MAERGHDLEYGPDHAYLSRVIFCSMVEEAEPTDDRVTGFGISLYPIVNSGRPLVVVNCQARTVGFAKAPENPFDMENGPPECFVTWTFEEYCGLSQSRMKAASRWRDRRR